MKKTTKIVILSLIAVSIIIAGTFTYFNGEMLTGKIFKLRLGNEGPKTEEPKTPRQSCIDNCACSGEGGSCSIEEYENCVKGCKEDNPETSARSIKRSR